jgi:trehalose 6-phosphate synthase
MTVRARSGIALAPCTAPAAGKPTFELGPDEMEVGVGRSRLHPIKPVVPKSGALHLRGGREQKASGTRLNLMSARLIVVSNRVAVPGTPRGPIAGGMAVAVKAALKNRNAAWFGWSGEVAHGGKSHARAARVKNVDHIFFDLSAVDIQEYYSGFANNVLWPILHYRVDLQKYTLLDASGYLRVNHLFADRLSKLLNDDDIVWVHDYHLMPLARELRSRGSCNAIGFFLHSPCAPPDVLHAMPRHSEILNSLIHYDLVGFQTDNDRDNFRQYLVSQGARAVRDGALEMGGRRTRLGVFPVGIETAAFRRLARVAERCAGFEAASARAGSSSGWTGSTAPKASSTG